ncbi:MAG TPA: adenylate/guanylate cyclase domain-containing protein [Candidatus Limnocylindria bacterium]|nr:adenylate/guanylate cyclase domain-containing protein [Candidatus Limnocylindria bacterium]
MTSALPTGTVTFLFTDIEGSTGLLRALGMDTYDRLLVEHGRILREALCAATGRGHEVRVEGDSFFVAFQSAPDAVAAAVTAQRALAAQAFPGAAEVRVRMGLHTGEGRPAAAEAGADYVGIDVHRAARIAAAAHGGQIVISDTTWTLVRDSLPPGVSARDLGPHRFKDFADAERIHQLVIDGLRSEFPPLRSLDRTPNNLPAQLTTFVGRAQLEEVRALLRDGARLLTLTGPGGTGKTRLSIEAAGDVADAFPDGVYWVPLAAITDSALVGPAIATSLGLHDAGSRPVAERIAEHLRDRTVLLVIDNFEQVLPAAPLIGELLRAAPKLKVIASSRAPLRVYGEQEFPVPPLTLADPGAAFEVLAQSEAVRLFVERAMAVKPDFQVTVQNARPIAELCARLDGLPLAIELAAARVKILPPDAILQRLGHTLDLLSAGSRDLPDRQRTLRGAIQWSYDLLEPPARTLFARLAAFAGGAWLPEIEAVCADGGDVLDGLSVLVDQSLLRQRDADGEPRFVMLVTIREYALERLEASGEGEAIRRRHAETYLDLARRTQPELTGPRQRVLLDRLERDHDNLRAAMEWAIGHDASIAMRLVGSMWRFWHMRGHLDEAENVARRVLALPFDASLDRERLVALDGAGGVSYWRGEFGPTQERYQEALDIATRLGDRRQVAEQSYNLGFTYQVDRTDIPRAVGLAEAALSTFRDLGDRPGIAKSLWSLSYALFQLDDRARSRPLLAECIALMRELDDRFGLAWALHAQALNDMKDGMLEGAYGSIGESLRIFADAGDVSGITLLLMDSAILAALRGDLERAVRLFAAGERVRDESGAMLANVIENWQLPAVDVVRDASARLTDARVEGGRLTRDEAIALALGNEVRA